MLEPVSTPRGGVTRQGVVLSDLPSLCDCQYNFSPSLLPLGDHFRQSKLIGGRE